MGVFACEGGLLAIGLAPSSDVGTPCSEDEDEDGEDGMRHVPADLGGRMGLLSPWYVAVNRIRIEVPANPLRTPASNHVFIVCQVVTAPN